MNRTRGFGRTWCTSPGGWCWPNQVGPFGNPTSDSSRTMITSETTCALVVVFAPVALAAAVLVRTVETTADRMVAFARPRRVVRWSAADGVPTD